MKTNEDYKRAIIYLENQIEEYKHFAEVNMKLEEEIKKLKSDLSLVIKERDDNIEQNKKLEEERNKWRWKYNRLKSEFNLLQDKNIKLKEQNSYRNKIVDIIPQDEKSVSEETIQDLQERIRFLEQCLDNKEKVNISLREENERLSDFLNYDWE